MKIQTHTEVTVTLTSDEADDLLYQLEEVLPLSRPWASVAVTLEEFHTALDKAASE